MHTKQLSIAIVTKPTRISGIKRRWATASSAAFRMEQAASHEVERRRKKLSAMGDSLCEQDLADVSEAVDMLSDNDQYQSESDTYEAALELLLSELDIGYPLQIVERKYLSNFDFGRCAAVVVLGPDGLVANAAKYVDDLPIIGVNPDPTTYDGILVLCAVGRARQKLQRTLKQQCNVRQVTLAEVKTNNGQSMLAFNDFFVGCASHISARYTMELGSRLERQSSSGVIISTGAGSTGWLSSMFNMANGFSRMFTGSEIPRFEMPWSDRRLAWAVREPFASKHSGAGHGSWLGAAAR